MGSTVKFLVRERMFDIGDDYWVEDENGDRVFHVDGKVLRIRETFQLEDKFLNLMSLLQKGERFRWFMSLICVQQATTRTTRQGLRAGRPGILPG